MNIPLLVTCGVITNNENKILLIKRARDPFKGKWCFPAGVGAFENENIVDPKEAVDFEVRADLGCGFDSEFFAYSFNDFGIPTVSLFFVGKLVGDIGKTSGCVDDFGWFSFNEVKNMDLGFEHREIIEKYFGKV